MTFTYSFKGNVPSPLANLQVEGWRPKGRIPLANVQPHRFVLRLR